MGQLDPKKESNFTKTNPFSILPHSKKKFFTENSQLPTSCTQPLLSNDTKFNIRSFIQFPTILTALRETWNFPPYFLPVRSMCSEGDITYRASSRYIAVQFRIENGCLFSAENLTNHHRNVPFQKSGHNSPPMYLYLKSTFRQWSIIRCSPSCCRLFGVYRDHKHFLYCILSSKTLYNKNFKTFWIQWYQIYIIWT